jgi:hypothetical protein
VPHNMYYGNSEPLIATWLSRRCDHPPTHPRS